MIRPATVSDLSEIMDLAGRVMAELQPEYPFHRGRAAETLRRRIVSDTGLVAVLDDGAIFGGLTAELGAAPWVMGTQATCDLRWVLPDRRGRWGHALIRHFEAWGARLGARVLGVSQTGRDAAGYYERLGYRPAEMMFWKAV